MGDRVSVYVCWRVPCEWCTVACVHTNAHCHECGKGNGVPMSNACQTHVPVTMYTHVSVYVCPGTQVCGLHMSRFTCAYGGKACNEWERIATFPEHSPKSPVSLYSNPVGLREHLCKCTQAQGALKQTRSPSPLSTMSEGLESYISHTS